MRILIAPNSFKESLSSVQISKIISKELSEEKKINLTVLPLNDGGDGFLEVIRFIYDKDIYQLSVNTNFAGIQSDCEVLIRISTKELFIESAEVIGLKKVPLPERNPLKLSSYPVGKLIKDLLILRENGSIPEFEKIVIGIGGTATIDFGVGAVNALGVKFLDKNDLEIETIPENFELISRIDFSKTKKILSDEIKISCIVDVQTSLLGEHSAVDLYGTQKGAAKNELMRIKSGIEHIAAILKDMKLIDDPFALNGAGGGLAAGLKIFLNSEIIPAEKFILETILQDVDNYAFDFIITGEGRFDNQSFEGKATGELIKKFTDKTKKIFLVCGKIEDDIRKQLPPNVQCFQLLDLYAREEEAKQKVEEGLKIISERIKKIMI